MIIDISDATGEAGAELHELIGALAARREQLIARLRRATQHTDAATRAGAHDDERRIAAVESIIAKLDAAAQPPGWIRRSWNDRLGEVQSDASL